MFTQINLYFKFSEVRIKSYLFTHLTYKVKTGPPRVGATAKSDARNTAKRGRSQTEQGFRYYSEPRRHVTEAPGRKAGYLE